MLFLQFLQLLALLVVCSLGPGLFFARWLRLKPLEKLNVAIGLSLLVVYLLATGVFLLNLGSWAYWAVSILCLILLFLRRMDLRQLGANRQIRRHVAGFGFLFFFGALLLCYIRHYSGDGWAGDWHEHYSRSLFFLQHGPVNTLFLKQYILPARPPMMNVLGAHFLAHARPSFELFQVLMLFLNLLVFFPCALLLDLLAKRGRRALAILVILLACSPVVMQNVTFTWTKLFTCYYVLLGTYFYLRGSRRRDATRIIVAFLALAAAALVHYSAGPYVAFFAIHYAFVVWRRRWREPLIAVTACMLLLFSWFGWSMRVYGVKGTFLSNTTVNYHGSGKMTLAQRAAMIRGNMVTALVPHFLRVPLSDVRNKYWQPNLRGFWRDYWFVGYEGNLWMGVGLVSGPLALMLLLAFLFSRRGPDWHLRLFWLGFLVIGFVLGAVVDPEAEPYGAIICFLPIVLLGPVLVAANFFRLPFVLRGAIALGCVADFVLGVFLQMHMQRLAFEMSTFGADKILPINDALLCFEAIDNSLIKPILGVTFLGDHFAPAAAAAELLILLSFAILLNRMAKAASAGPSKRPFRAAGLIGSLAIASVIGIGWCTADQWSGPDRPTEVFSLAGYRALPEYAAAQRNPESVDAWLNLCAASSNAGSRQESIYSAIEAYVLDPADHRARYMLRLVTRLYSVTDPEVRATERFYRDPASAGNQLRYAVVLLAHGHLELAARHIAESQRLQGANPDPNLAAQYGTLGLMYEEMNRRREAMECFQRRRQIDPANPEAYVGLARIYVAQKDISAATTALLQMIVLGRNTPDVWKALEPLYHERDPSGQAIVTGDSPSLNLNSPLMQADLANALADLVAACVHAHRIEDALKIKRLAIEQYRCPRATLDAILQDR